mmetsp:Transcript_23571/g.51924  ORF Transcript_23571/g.51924 Transcript_23571/m.51924 type:complete len:100 (+) Transcript_23571:132-431(+)
MMTELTADWMSMLLMLCAVPLTLFHSVAVLCIRTAAEITDTGCGCQFRLAIGNGLILTMSWKKPFVIAFLALPFRGEQGPSGKTRAPQGRPGPLPNLQT